MSYKTKMGNTLQSKKKNQKTQKVVPRNRYEEIIYNTQPSHGDHYVYIDLNEMREIKMGMTPRSFDTGLSANMMSIPSDISKLTSSTYGKVRCVADGVIAIKEAMHYEKYNCKIYTRFGILDGSGTLIDVEENGISEYYFVCSGCEYHSREVLDSIININAGESEEVKTYKPSPEAYKRIKETSPNVSPNTSPNVSGGIVVDDSTTNTQINPCPTSNSIIENSLKYKSVEDIHEEFLNSP